MFSTFNPLLLCLLLPIDQLHSMYIKEMMPSREYSCPINKGVHRKFCSGLVPLTLCILMLGPARGGVHNLGSISSTLVGCDTVFTTCQTLRTEQTY